MKFGNMMRASLTTCVIVGAAGAAHADSIDPTSFTANLAVGESATVSKEVVISAGGPGSALIDVHFLMDTSGSMGSVIATAKSAAANLFSEINAFGDVAASVGVFSEGAYLPGETFRTPPGLVINSPLTTISATTVAAINAITLNNPDGGGDYPENGYDAIWKSAENLEWRSGSNRFMFIFTDAPAKGDLARAADALDDYGIDLYTLSYGALDDVSGTDPFYNGYGDDVGGTVLPSTTDPEALVEDILEGISSGFAEYNTVTVGDLGAGLPEIAVSTVCTGADIGACVGAEAVGDYDRSVDRTFTFDVTFTRLAAGTKNFSTYALVDGGIVATEADRFPDGGVAPVPAPAALPLLLSALGVAGFVARRRKAA